MPDTDPAREVLRDIPPELAIDCALRWREQRDEAITQRDQVAHERDALRKELDALRAAQTAPPQPLTTTETQPAPHTPGPWIVEDTGTHLWIGPPRSDGSGKVADIVVSMDIAQFTPEARARAIANACLIAAAPDLRAARAAKGDA